MMERIASRVEFTGAVEQGGRYALVDDNVTSGGTLADLGSYIQENGGQIVAIIALTTSSRSGNMEGSRKFRDLVERRFGDVVLKELGINPQALTEAEAQYLAGFKDADELRGRIARSRQDRSERLRSKGIRESAAPEGLAEPFGIVEPLGAPSVCCPKCKSTNIMQSKSKSGPAKCLDCGFSVADKASDLKAGGHTDSEHLAAIRKALAEGAPVPPEVLADYPGLHAPSVITPKFKKWAPQSRITSYGVQTLFLQLRAGTMEEMKKGLDLTRAQALARDNLNKDSNYYLNLADDKELQDPAAEEMLYHLTNAVAYHGTMNKVDSFSTDFSGSGMGSQSYGWGLYFAGSKAVADYYRKFQRQSADITTWSAGPLKLKSKGEYLDYSPNGTDTPYNQALASLAEELLADEDQITKAYEEGSTRGAQARMLKVCDGVIDYYGREDAALVPYLKIFRKNVEVGLTLKADFKEGYVITADIPEPSEFLDWDKSFSEQSPAVKAALKGAGIDKDYRKNFSDFSTPQETRGRSVRGSNIYAFLSMTKGSDKAASLYLLELGIPGIKYWDAINRDGIKGGENFVVFDASRVRIKQAFNQLVVAAPLESITSAETATGHLPPGISKITQAPAFKAWFGDSKVVYPDTGEPMPVFHGSTHEFEAFKLEAVNHDNYWGQGLYFTTSAEDASINYATVTGPDFQSRVERRKDEMVYDYENNPLPFLEKWLAITHPEQEGFPKVDIEHPVEAADLLSQMMPGTELSPLMFEDEGHPAWYAIADIILPPVVTAEVKGATNGMVYYVFLRCVNPFMIKNPYPLHTETYDEETDEYEEDPEGSVIYMQLRDAFIEAVGGNQYGMKLWDGFMEAACEGDSIDWARGIEYLSHEVLMNDEGDMVMPGSVIADLAAALDFDGICQPNPVKEFKGMKGLKPGTMHWVVWDPRQVKAVFNKGGFDPSDKRMNQSLKPLSLKQSYGGDRDHAQALDETGFWGSQGAGAVIFCVATGRLLLPLRSQSVQEPGTWGTWGGAMDEGHTPEQTVAKEIWEEAGYAGRMQLIPLMVFEAPNSSFRYHNFLVVVPQEFEPSLNWETARAEWFPLDDLPEPLHFGLDSLLSDSPSMRKIHSLLPKRPIESAASTGVWYRGSNAPDPLAMRKDEGSNAHEQYGPGIYFTDSPDIAAGYGKVSEYRIATSEGFATMRTPVASRTFGVGRLIKKAPDYQDTLVNWDENPIKACS
jgi:8-oxo-dGTP pyrophosphatase MutT (NUDIX family)